MHEVAQRPSERRSLIDQEDNKRLCLQGVHTGTYGTNHSTNISKISCPFHHRVYYQLTIACFPVGLISTMDRVRLLIDRKSQGSIPGQAWKFSVLFQRLGCSFYCKDLIHFHIFIRISKCDSFHPTFAIYYLSFFQAFRFFCWQWPQR